MNYIRKFLWILAAFSAAVIIATGCSKKGPVAISEARQDLFQSATPAVKANWDKAVTAIATNGYVEAIVTLRSMRFQSGLTYQQSAAVDETLSAVNLKLARAVADGDPAATEAANKIKQMFGGGR